MQVKWHQKPRRQVERLRLPYRRGQEPGRPARGHPVALPLDDHRAHRVTRDDVGAATISVPDPLGACVDAGGSWPLVRVWVSTAPLHGVLPVAVLVELRADDVDTGTGGREPAGFEARALTVRQGTGWFLRNPADLDPEEDRQIQAARPGRSSPGACSRTRPCPWWWSRPGPTMAPSTRDGGLASFSTARRCRTRTTGAIAAPAHIPDRSCRSSARVSSAAVLPTTAALSGCSVSVRQV